MQTKEDEVVAKRIHHLENVKFYMSYLQEYTKIIKNAYLANLF
jgi:hypothetical protein